MENGQGGESTNTGLMA